MIKDDIDKRIAVQRLHLKDGTVLNKHVVEFKNGKPLRIYPLRKELPQTAWIQGDFYLSEATDLINNL